MQACEPHLTSSTQPNSACPGQVSAFRRAHSEGLGPCLASFRSPLMRAPCEPAQWLRERKGVARTRNVQSQTRLWQKRPVNKLQPWCLRGLQAELHSVMLIDQLREWHGCHIFTWSKHFADSLQSFPRLPSIARNPAFSSAHVTGNQGALHLLAVVDQASFAPMQRCIVRSAANTPNL